MLEVENNGKQSKPCNVCELEEIGLVLLIINDNRKRMGILYGNMFDTYIMRLINSLGNFVV